MIVAGNSLAVAVGEFSPCCKRMRMEVLGAWTMGEMDDWFDG